jgi:hypothetical protein
MTAWTGIAAEPLAEAPPIRRLRGGGAILALVTARWRAWHDGFTLLPRLLVKKIRRRDDRRYPSSEQR